MTPTHRTIRSSLTLSGFVFFVLTGGCGASNLSARMPRQSVVPAEHDYVEHLVAAAKKRRLAFSTMWLRLGHYKKSSYSDDYTSEADGALFFMAKDGKHNPEAELTETLRGFFHDPYAYDKKLKGAEAFGEIQHPACRFPARLAYLTEQLDIDIARIPVQACPRLAKFWQQMSPKSASFIFSSYYLNNPASAFGHVFLRFNKAGDAVTGERQELLDYGIDYSADVDTGNAIIYAFKGIFGFFPGTFKQMPFYYKVRAYNDYESRDMWEYELNLSPKALAMLVAHIWELGSTYFDYYYIDENCAYHVLGLVEVADPKLDLSSKLSDPVIPAQTVQILSATPGLVKHIRFRPSLRSQFRARVKDLNSDELDIVDELVEDPNHTLPSAWSLEKQARVFDAAADLVDILYGKKLIHHQSKEAAELKQRLLKRRAALLVATDAPKVPVPWDKVPSKGHGARRFGLAPGADSKHNGYLSIDFRLALHDLADPAEGFPDLSQIEFTSGRLRMGLWNDTFKVMVDDAAFVRIVSLTSIDRFDPQFSWKFSAGATTLRDKSCEWCLAGNIEGGTGLAQAFFNKGVVVYATLDGQALYSPSIDMLAGFRLGVGPAGGLRLKLDDNLIILSSAKWRWNPEQAQRTWWQADTILRYSPVYDFALSLEARAYPGLQELQLFALFYL